MNNYPPPFFSSISLMCFTHFSSVHHFLHYRSEEGLIPSVIDKTLIRERRKFQALGRVCICVSVRKTGLDCHVGGLSMTVQGSVCAQSCDEEPVATISI